jgi:Leucine-rich repeat (LRR) protein
MGNLSFIHVSNGQVVFPRIPLGKARGAVPVPADAKLSLDLSYQGAQDSSSLAKLRPGPLVSVNCLNLDNMNDESVKNIAQLPGLLQLRLTETDITDKGLASICHAKDLTDLDLAATGITLGGLQQLGVPASLRRLRLDLDNLADSPCSFLTPLKELRSLALHRCNISDQALKTIAKLNNLVSLNVSQNPRVTDAGMQYLLGMKNLHYLDLSETGITKKAFVQFKKMPRLLKIDLNFCKIDHADLLKLKEEMPDCKIITTRELRADPDAFAPLK